MELAAAGASRRELYEQMNSRALGESPRRFFRCSAAASLGSVEVYSRIWFKDSSSRGRSWESWAGAHVDAEDAIEEVDLDRCHAKDVRKVVGTRMHGVVHVKPSGEVECCFNGSGAFLGLPDLRDYSNLKLV